MLVVPATSCHATPHQGVGSTTGLPPQFKQCGDTTESRYSSNWPMFFKFMIVTLFQCRRDISFYWSATILQRCVRKWLSQIKAKRVRQAQLTVRDRAARTIQHRWKQFIAEKRRYEATYSRLKAKLHQEQLAASLIIAELQAQTRSVCLPSTAANIPRKRLAASNSIL